ncbi:MAG: hypothetical protein JO289_14340 [Xanthobacteraceae bacterium]|nr:hypothetical protein [Xanthobacteraceae bacterium]
MARATLIVHERRLDASGGIMEIKVWRVPNPVRPSIHGYKYSLFYGRPGVRLVGFDNERGKGDHMHVAGAEKAYSFTSLDQLLADFFAEVRKAGGEP